MALKLFTIPLISILSFFWLFFTDNNEKSPNTLDNNIAKCHTTTQKFADLGNDQSFVDFHKNPVPVNFQSKAGEMISYKVEGGKEANAYFIKSIMPSDDYLLVFHEWYGLNAYVKNESEKFAERFNELNVLALDLYDGEVAETSEAARNLMQEVKTQRALAIIKGAEKFVGKDANIFTVGWCFGGGWSLQAAIELDDKANGAVMFYGMPEQDTERLKKLQCDVLGIFAEQDQWITPETVASFKEKMETTDQELIIKSYNADHGFANPGNPDFNQEMATDAYKQMFDFIRARR